MRLSNETSDSVYNQIAACLPQPAFRPHSLFERFGIEALSTTESALDDLRWHKMIRDNNWNGNVIGRDLVPGYPLIGRMRSLAELRGIASAMALAPPTNTSSTAMKL